MLRRIVVPLDGSVLAEQALAYAVEISIPTGARLLLLRAVYTHTLAGVDPRERKEGAIIEATEYLEHVAVALGERGYTCQTVVPYGHPAECIVEEARLASADLIVMTTHGRTGPGRMLFGSVAQEVVSRSTVPVLVTRGWLPTQRRPCLPDRPVVIVPLDGSEFAETAIQPAITLTEDLGGDLLLLRAVAGAAFEGAAREYLDCTAARLLDTHPDLNVTAEIRVGTPAQAIEDAYRQNEAALVFMSTHAHGGIVRTVAGSIAGEVLSGGRAPVVLVRPDSHPARA
jgi:nucleotide-binding universal stress UspA family protein